MSTATAEPANGAQTALGASQTQNGGQATTQTNGSSGSGISEPWAKEWIKGDFTLNHEALSRLPDHLKALEPTLKRQQNLEGILIDYAHKTNLAGQKGLTPLMPGSPPEVIAKRKEFLDTANGVPKTWQEYGVQKPQDLKDEVWDGKLAEGVAQWAHKYSVPPTAVKELVDLSVSQAKGRLTENEQHVTQFWANEQKIFDAAIRTENIPAERANALVEKGAVALGLDLKNESTKTFLQGATARLMAMHHAMAIGEDSAAVAGAEPTGMGTDYAAQAKDIRQNPANPLNGAYWNKGNKFSRSDHDAAVQRVNELIRLATEQEGKKKR